jgi:hypothetical protein
MPTARFKTLSRMIRRLRPPLKLTLTRTEIARILLLIGVVGAMMAETIAQVVMFGLDIEGLIALDVTLTRLRTGCMSLAVVDVPVVLAIAVVLIHGIPLPRQDVMVVQVRYIMNVILEVVVTVLDIGLVVEKLAVIRLVSKEVLLLVEIVHLIDLVE